MASSTHASSGIVLRKTKLGETDLIITFLQETGERAQAIAKGARKPQSSFSSRLELGNYVKLLLIDGKSLDIVRESHLIEGFDRITFDYDEAIYVSAMLEIAEKLSHENLPNERLFQLLHAAIQHAVQAESSSLAPLAIAFALKAFAFNGIKPAIEQCIMCGEPLDYASASVEAEYWVSMGEGGVVCSACPSGSSSMRLKCGELQWLRVLLYATFDDVITCECDVHTELVLLQFCREWMKFHIGTAPRSIEFIMNTLAK